MVSLTEKERDMERKMEVAEVLHMNGGNGEASYATNSSVQRKVISLTRTTREHAITEAYCSTFPRTLCIADLGCSSGPNTLLVISEAVETIYKTCHKLGKRTPEFQVHLNDLPSNDFNTIFNSLPGFQAQMRDRIGNEFGPCFINGVPGSFYGRLFPSKSLHFVHSSYSLHWLSQVPKGIESNKRNIYGSRNSPPGVLKAYYEQFQADFSLFLKCRSEEVEDGGCMVLTFRGRSSNDHGSKEDWDLLEMAMNEMVTEGLIEEEMIEEFNIPEYSPSPDEIISEVEKEGSFIVDRLDVSNVNWSASGKEDGSSFAESIRAVVEPLLATRFGETLINEIFDRYKEKVVQQVQKEVTQLTNVTVSVRRVVKRGS